MVTQLFKSATSPQEHFGGSCFLESAPSLCGAKGHEAAHSNFWLINFTINSLIALAVAAGSGVQPVSP